MKLRSAPKHAVTAATRLMVVMRNALQKASNPPNAESATPSPKFVVLLTKDMST